MQLTDRDWTILSALNMEQGASCADVARRVGVREHTVRRTISIFVENGILRQNSYIDAFRLGFQRIGVYFALEAPSDALRKKLIEYLIRHEKIAYLAEISGDFQFIMSLFVRCQTEVAKFFDELTQKFGAIVARRGFETLVSIVDFQLLRPGESTDKRKSVGFQQGVKSVDIDELDHNILVHLASAHSPLDPEARIARAVKASVPTVRYRVQKLRENGIVLGDRLLIDAEEFQWQFVAYNLAMKNHSSKTTAGLKKYLRTLWYVSFVVEYLGSFDFTVGCFLPKLRDAAIVPQRLRERFPKEISWIRTIPVLCHHKVDNYPLRTWSSNFSQSVR